MGSLPVRGVSRSLARDGRFGEAGTAMTFIVVGPIKSYDGMGVPPVAALHAFQS